MNRRDAIRAVMAMPAVTSIQVAKVETEDVIVLESPGILSFDESEHIRQYAQQIWPGRKVLVLSEGLTMRIARAGHTT